MSQLLTVKQKYNPHNRIFQKEMERNVSTHCLVGQVLVGGLLAFLLGNLANHNLVIRVVLAKATEGIVILGANNGRRLGELLGQDDALGVKIGAVAQGVDVSGHSSFPFWFIGFSFPFFLFFQGTWRFPPPVPIS